MSEPLGLSEFRDWLNWETTKKVFKLAGEERQDWLDRLQYGGTLTTEADPVAETGKAVGVLYGLDFFLVGVEELLKRLAAEAEVGAVQDWEY